MYNINLFVEDFGHEAFLDALLQRLIEQYSIPVTLRFESSRGGHGVVIDELKTYIRDLGRGRKRLPDMIIVATDGNCKGFLERKRQIDEVVKSHGRLVICAIPDPHIERWLLLDSAAFKKVLGKGCAAPTYKCQRDLYKQLLGDAVVDAGKEPVLGGMEYARPLIEAMDMDALERTEESLGRLLKSLRQKFQEWQRQMKHPELHEDSPAYVINTDSPQAGI
jgi:hypothetical protein